MSETRYYRVQGTVQGVGFRAATRDTAQRLSLVGWVRNRSDGNVELSAKGPARALDALETWLQDGPSAASVVSVSRDDASASLDESDRETFCVI